MSERRPKSAYELAMERLEASDLEAGVVKTALTDEQKAKIEEARRICAARIAEREILHRDALRHTPDPGERARLEEEFVIDRQRHESDRDREIERIRRAGS